MTADFPEAEHGERQVRKRGEIAGGADRPLRRHAGHETGVDEPLEKAHQLDAHPGESLQQARELQHQRQAHDRVIEQRADPGAVREDDVPLQERSLRRGDAGVRKQPKAGVDPVDGRIAGGEARGNGVRLAHRAERCRIDCHAQRARVHAPQLPESQRPGAKLQAFGFGHRSTSAARTTVRRGLKPIQ